MRRFFSKQQAKPQKNKMVANIQESDGMIIVPLSNNEYKDNMEDYLSALRGDMGHGNRESFSYKYDAVKNAYIISPSKDVTIENVLEEFGVIGIYASRAHTPGQGRNQ